MYVQYTKNRPDDSIENTPPQGCVSHFLNVLMKTYEIPEFEPPNASGVCFMIKIVFRNQLLNVCTIH